MHEPPPHRLQTVSWDVRTSDEGVGRTLLGELPDWWRQTGSRLLASALDEAAPPEQHYVIDELTLDLDVIPLHEWDVQLEDRFRERLGAWLANADLQKAEHRQSADASAWETWLYFLEFGYLPWWSPTDSPLTDPLRRLDSEPYSEEVDSLRSILNRSKSARIRLVRHLTDAELTRLSMALLREASEPWLIYWLKVYLEEVRNKEGDREAVWLEILVDVLPRSSTSRLPAFIGQMLEHWASLKRVTSTTEARQETSFRPSGIPAKAWEQGLSRIAERGAVARSRSIARRHLESLQVESKPNSIPREEDILTEQRNEPGSLKQKGNRPDAANKPFVQDDINDPTIAPHISGSLQKMSVVSLENRAESSDLEARGAQQIDERTVRRGSRDRRGAEHSIYIRHAGLVLVHPFLPRLFEVLDLWGEGEFYSSSAQEQAVYLLTYLSTGTESSPEYDMVVPKLFSGLDPETPILPAFQLSQEERQECEDMLAALLDHWGALKNTNPDMLRSGFLQREGKVTRLGSNWKIQLEQRAQDILLQKLPWGIGFIRLPWNPWTIHVDWG